MPKMIARMPLRQIDRLPPGLHAVAPSLYIAIGKDAEGKSSSRSWIFRYVANGRKRHFGIGSCRDIDRDQAEREVEKLRELRRQGIDPIDAKRAKTLDKALSITFEQCARRFYKSQEAGWSASHKRAWLADLERDVFSVIGNVPVDQITVKEVLAAIEPHWTTKHETASRNRGRIEKTLDYAKAMRHRTSEINPARWKGGLDAILPPPKKVKGEKQHLAAMEYRDVPAFVAKLRARDDNAAKALELLILCASRSAEIRDMRWSEVDFAEALWTIPAERMKARRKHSVPLTDRAVEILRSVNRKDGFVFDLDRDAMIGLVKTLGGDVTTHGLRSAFSTWAGEKTAFPRDIVERCIAHTTGSAAEQAYRRGEELERRRLVLDAWSKFVADGSDNKGKIVDFRAA
jgi:integrase